MSDPNPRPAVSDPTQLRDRAHSAARAVGLYDSMPNERRKVADAVLAEVAAEVEARLRSAVRTERRLAKTKSIVMAACARSNAGLCRDLLSVLRPSEAPEGSEQ